MARQSSCFISTVGALQPSVSRALPDFASPHDVLFRVRLTSPGTPEEPDRLLFGKPDFVFRRERVAVFVDGCFWHRHPGCKYAYTPKSRLEFWLPKFKKNVARDRLVTQTLRAAGWQVVRVWECDLTAARQQGVVHRLRRNLRAREPAESEDRASTG